MNRKFYVSFADSKKSIQVTYEEYVALRKMGEYYNAIISDNFFPLGKSLKLSFNQSFV